MHIDVEKRTINGSEGRVYIVTGAAVSKSSDLSVRIRIRVEVYIMDFSGASSSSAMEVDSPVRAKTRVVPWVEKYRPATVDDVAHQDEVVRTLKTSISQGNLPHLLMHGPPGTGKTTTILAVARALYGPELFRDRILELNASDDRGIGVVREKIKTFAQGAVGGQKASGYPCPRFKLIVLDEADTMTPEAQSALRRIMEAYSKVTRFCLICNYVTRIIEPLASRCAKFRFKPLPASSMIVRMQEIASSEGVSVTDDVMDSLLQASGGDMRKAVTYMQSCHQLSGGLGVTKEAVVDISGQVPKQVISTLWGHMQGKGFDAVNAATKDIIAEGYPLNSIMAQLHDMAVTSADLSDKNKALICEKLAQVDFCLSEGSSEALQLLDLCAYISRRLSSLNADVDTTTTTH
jgi:replication factor C subunit 2/4